MKKYSLASQIAEVERELGQRTKVYGNQVRMRRMTLEEANLRWDLMKSVLDTLQWLQANEEAIKAKPGVAA